MLMGSFSVLYAGIAHPFILYPLRSCSSPTDSLAHAETTFRRVNGCVFYNTSSQTYTAGNHK
jgi:hypothetical protein